MKTTVNTKALLKSLNRVGTAIASHGFLPILSSIKIEAKDGALILSATNLDLSITDKIDACRISKTGGVVVAYKMFKNFIANATSEETRLESSDKLLSVSHGENHGNFEILPVEEFPPAFEVKDATELQCSLTELVVPLQKVEHAMSEDQSRYALNGLNIHRNGDGTEFAATDGFRLSVFKSDLPFEGDIILPKMAVAAIIKTLEEDMVSISHDAGVIIIRNGNLEISSRLVEAKFPKYQELIPEPVPQALSAQRAELINAVTTAAIFLVNNEIGVQLKGDGKEVVVSCADRFKTKLIGAELAQQPDTTKSFNYRYLLDALNTSTSDAVRLECPPDRELVAIRDGALVEIINPLRVPK